MRSFIVPSQRVDIVVELRPPQDGVAKAMLTASTDARTVATARLEIAMESA
jgi:hypothetical protein